MRRPETPDAAAFLSTYIVYWHSYAPSIYFISAAFFSIAGTEGSAFFSIAGTEGSVGPFRIQPMQKKKEEKSCQDPGVHWVVMGVIRKPRSA